MSRNPSTIPLEKASSYSRSLSNEPNLDFFLPDELISRLKSPKSRDLMQAVQALDSLYHNLTTYLPRPLIETAPVPGQPQARFLQGTMLFADVTGFTPLTERLREMGEEGAEQLNRMINQLFAALLDPLTNSHGELLIFAGDAVLAYFPALSETQDALWASRAALRMIRAIAPFDTGPTPLSMSVGLARGRFFAAQVGTWQRMEYVAIGKPLQASMIAESVAEPRQVVLSPGLKTLLADNFRYLPAADGHTIIVDDLGDTLGEYELRVPTRRRRSRIAIEWEPGALQELLDKTLTEVKSLATFFPPDVLDRIVAHQKTRQFPGEHRLVTVLFVNLRGFDELVETLGQDHTDLLTDWLDQYFVSANELINGYGGLISHVDPYVHGFTLLCPFGAPLAAEETSHRAVAAAIHLEKALQKLNTQIADKLATLGIKTQPLAYHIGITFGPIFTGQVGWQERREFVVIGDDVNLSARLMSKSAPDQILISGWVYERVRLAFECRALQPMKLKGKANPVSVYAVQRRASASEWLVQAAIRPLVGRGQEISTLEDAMDATLSGQGGVITLTGETGIGKTRLIAEITRRARNWGLKTLAGRCLSYTQMTPYAPWAEILWRWFNLDAVVESAGGREKQQHVRQTLDEMELAWATAEINDLLDLSEFDLIKCADPQHAIFSLLNHLARSQPTLLIVDDLHWTDQASLNALIKVARLALTTDLPLLLLIATRPGPVETHWFSSLTNGLEAARSQYLPLSGLDKPHTGKLAARLFRAADAAPELVDWLYERSGGNPLFTTQLLYALASDDALEIDTDNRQVVLNKESPFVPATIREILLSRVDQLPQATRMVLKQAAVIGDTFTLDRLLALSRLDKEQIQNHLAILIEKDFIAPGHNYTFAHILLREAVYASLPYAQRRLWHHKIADMLQTSSNATRENLNELISHYSQSDTPLKGIPYLLLAGDQACARRLWGDALVQYNQVLQMARGETDMNTTLANTYTAIGDVYTMTDHPDKAIKAYRDAITQRPESPELDARLGMLLAADQFAQANEHLIRAWNNLEKSPWRPWVAGALAWHSQEMVKSHDQQTPQSPNWWQRGLNASPSHKARSALQGFQVGHFLPDLIFWLQLALYDVLEKETANDSHQPQG